MGKPANKPETYLICALLILATAAVYWQVASFEFVNWDDPLYVRDNPMVQAGLSAGSIYYAFVTPYEANWIPLVWVSYMIDHDVGAYLFDSGSPAIHHLGNLGLHVANVVLLLLVFLRLTGSLWRSAVVAALFAVHPLHVESVAWVAERKDVLSTLFWLLTMLAYIHYAKKRTACRYALVVVSLALGLMAKPMLVTLPIVLVLLDYWPLGPRNWVGDKPRAKWATLWERVADKMSLFVLAAAGCAVTLWTQQQAGSLSSTQVYPLGVRVANALVSYADYIAKTLWPRDLAFVYPHPGNSLPIWRVVVSGIVLAGVSALATVSRRRRPYFIVGWLWYVVTLLPVIGFVQVGKQAMADRYTYVPLIGLFVMIVWGLADVLARPGERFALRARSLSIGALAVVTALALVAHRQVGYWRDSETLCRHAIQVSDANYVAHYALGDAKKDRGDFDGAIRQYRIALKLYPDYVEAHCNLGGLLHLRGKDSEAIRHYQQVLRTHPDYFLAHNNLGLVLLQQGKLDDAIAHFRAALRSAPNCQSVRDNLEDAEMRRQRGY